MHSYFGYAIDFARRCRSFVTRSLATLFCLSLACPLYSVRLILASSLLCEGLNSRYPSSTTSLSLLPYSRCSVTRSNSSNWEEHSSVRTPAKRLVRQVLNQVS